MAYVLADNIISPLGVTSEENYLSVKTGKSGIRTYVSGTLGVPEDFTASLLLADFEELAYESARKALASMLIDIDPDKAVFILSSTKGSIESHIDLSESALRIATRLGITTLPIVVCNACISGLSALILASRLIDQGEYDYAVVCGCDTPSRFIISGFQSLKALSTEPCRPFDMERFGLNLGEAAATIVLGKEKKSWQIGNGFIKNDAFHISTPSKTAEGLYAALASTLASSDKEDLAFINAHGTATLFNDQMESIAIKRAELSDIPTNALKGYFGHTLGAAGILETIISMKALDDHTILGTKGFEELGVSGKVNISEENQHTNKQSFIKMLSGFGGCNATLLVQKTSELDEALKTWKETNKNGRNFGDICRKLHAVKIKPHSVSVDGKELEVNKDHPLLTAIYKKYVGDYPKYYKMDGLSRLGFIASELLLQEERKDIQTVENVKDTTCNRAIVLFNHSSSIAADQKYIESIQDKDNYFPSPSVFVYTLPNIVTGEIAIRNGCHGETSFYILPCKSETLMRCILQTSFQDARTESVIAGWVDYVDEACFEAEIYIFKKN